MTDSMLDNFMQLQRKIVDPQDVYDQANGCRGMLLMIEALFRQGKFSQEARDYLHIQYSTLLNSLWMEDLGKEYDKSRPKTFPPAPPLNPFRGLEPLQVKQSPIVTDEAIKHTAESAVFWRNVSTARNATGNSSLQNPTQGPPSPSVFLGANYPAGPVDPPTHTFSSSRGPRHPEMPPFPSVMAGASYPPRPGGRPPVQDHAASISVPRLPQNRPRAQAAPMAAFSSAKSLHAAENPELYKNSLESIRNHPEIKGIGWDLAERVLNEMMTESPDVTWDAVAGLQYAKSAVREMIVWPLTRPDIFTGAREPPRGMLLFGPPGTGKTLIGKCIAAEAKATFFSISASTLVSKWVGESNQLVRALFTIARIKQPSVIFLDELDSLLSARRSQDQKYDRQLITELFVQLDGAKTYKDNRVMFIGATNRPFDLDDAARRRLVKRLYIALPDKGARAIIIKNCFKGTKHSLTDEQLDDLALRTKGELYQVLKLGNRDYFKSPV